jgi:hypothetical protein
MTSHAGLKRWRSSLTTSLIGDLAVIFPVTALMLVLLW